MLKTFCYSKIHRATIKSVDLNYEGSITIDQELLKKADIQPYEQVHILNINNGNRFITYTIPAEPNSGIIQVNGAAAHLCKADDLIIIISYCQINISEINPDQPLKPKVVLVDQNNKIVKSEEA